MSNEDTVLKYEKCNCEYFPYFVGTLYVYKGLLVVFGLFLAYESRNVKYFYINDSRFVSIATYFVVIIIGISAPLSLVLAEQYFIDPAYGLSVSMIVLACTICLLVLYVPKVRQGGAVAGCRGNALAPCCRCIPVGCDEIVQITFVNK